ncbi:MAG TPA: PilZ domain-containing protein [Nitrococcus sp.]|nr:PilZ domain-containing protein [Nitrococcus sp.]
MPIKSARLTTEELDYLRELFAADRSCGATSVSPHQLLLDPCGSDAELLLQLIKADRLRLTAERAHYVFDFNLCIEYPADSPVAVRFSYPTIIERYGTERATRVRPHQDDIQVADKKGLLQAPQVRDISVSGLSLTDLPSTLTRPGRHQIQLQLQLAKSDPLELEAQVVRVNRDYTDTKHRTLGIRFEHIDAAAQAILNRYVFLHHPAVRP